MSAHAYAYAVVETSLNACQEEQTNGGRGQQRNVQRIITREHSHRTAH